MAKTKEQKSDALKILKEQMTGAKSMIVADFNGLTVVATEELRNKCKEENVEFLAVKKTLFSKYPKIDQATKLSIHKAMKMSPPPKIL